jgi:tetratricopeptide (TPR) repeat protein
MDLRFGIDRKSTFLSAVNGIGEICVRAFGDVHDLIRHRGQTYRPIGRHGEAPTDINRAIELWPEAGWAVAERGGAYRLLDRYDDALIDSTGSPELNPDDQCALTSPGGLTG